MKPAVPLQTLILQVLTPLLLALTGFWGWFVYGSIHRTILEGFDRKLLALSGGTSAFIDADAHATYQRRRTITALASSPDGQLLGWDPADHELVSIDPAAGGALPLTLHTEGEIRSLALDPAGGRLIALSAAGDHLERFTLAPARPLPPLALELKFDGIFFDGTALSAWHGMQLFHVDPVTGACSPLPIRLPEIASALCVDAGANQLLGISADARSLVAIDRGGNLLRRTVLGTAGESPERATPGPQGLALAGGRLFTGGTALTSIDRATGILDQSATSPGYLSENAPFYRQYREPIIAIRNAAHLTYLYTDVYLGDDRLYYVLDGSVGEKHSLPGSNDRIPTAEGIDGAQRAQFLGRPWVSPIQQWDQWGLLKTSSFPIHASDGRIVALAGADVDISIIREKTRWALFAVLFVGAGSLVAAGFVSLLITRSLTRPLRNLKESALRIAAGYYDTAAPASGHHETTGLAVALNLLSERLDEEVRRSQAYQVNLHARRRQTTLAGALEDLAVRGTAPSNERPSPTRQVTGASWRGLDGLFWIGPPQSDPVGTACLRARLSFLARGLLASSLPAEKAPANMLASFPALSACALWRTATHRLDYAARRPCRLRVDGEYHTIDGVGHLVFANDVTCEWVDDAGESAARGEERPTS
jgi:HAMP domain-containing protein